MTEKDCTIRTNFKATKTIRFDEIKQSDFTVKVDVTGPIVEGSVEVTTPSGLAHLIQRWICDTQEEALKKALFGIGWSPPAEHDDNVHHWNFEVSDEKLVVCKGRHLKQAPCEYEDLDVYDTLRILNLLRSRVIELEMRLGGKI